MFINTEIYALPREAFSKEFGEAITEISLEHPLIDSVRILHEIHGLTPFERKCVDFHLTYIIKAAMGY